MKRIILPYNPGLKEVARKLRQNMTFSEARLWNILKNRKMMEYDFDRQKPIGNAIVDFYCKDLMLAIEVDGITHHDELAVLKDAERQKELEALGVRFLRFSALQVVHDLANVRRGIENWILEFEEKNGILKHIREKREQIK